MVLPIASGSKNKIAIQSQSSNVAMIDPKVSCARAPVVPDPVNDTARSGKGPVSAYIPPDAPISGSPLPVSALNETLNHASVLVERPYEQVQVASFVHEAAVHEVNTAHQYEVPTQNAVVYVQSTSGL